MLTVDIEAAEAGIGRITRQYSMLALSRRQAQPQYEHNEDSNIAPMSATLPTFVRFPISGAMFQDEAHLTDANDAH